jgi:hypothetical protein
MIEIWSKKTVKRWYDDYLHISTTKKQHYYAFYKKTMENTKYTEM